MAETYYAWNPVFDCITKEVDASGATIAEYTHEPKLYGGLISQHRSGVTSVYHYDAIGTTRALTNSSQAVTDTAVYTAFGEKVSFSGTTNNIFGYVGRDGYIDAYPVSSHSIRLRNYSGSKSTWLSVDPAKDDETQSPYNYCGNRPLLFLDPNGDVKRKTVKVYQVPDGGETDETIAVQMKNIEKLKDNLGDCGNFRWTIQWKLKKGLPKPAFDLSKGGYFVQHIRATYIVNACCGGAAGVPLINDFWEAWATNPPPRPGQPGYLVTKYAQNNDPKDDTFKSETVEDNTFGAIEYTGEYGWVKGPIPMPPFGENITCKKLGTGKLPCSQTDPRLPPYSVTILGTKGGKMRRHAVKVKWDCCDCKK